jgi:peptide methionine sulfoxide reductase MsrA
VAATRSIALQARSGVLILTFDISQSRNLRNWAMEAKVFDAPVVTKVESNHTFYPAEGYHQDFLARNPAYPYIAINDLPKIESLKRLFPDSYRADPVLVSAAPSN